ncbi:MAG: CRTAC1 family protein [Gemmataceae bacterium]|nr:CRTAC1 family protein [Gemmataceae bacterium]
MILSRVVSCCGLSALLALCGLSCSSNNATKPDVKVAAPTGPTAGAPWFEDVAPASGIDFRHFDPATPVHYIQETLGSGLAWVDYNNDGWPDLFCVQDGPVRAGLQGEGPKAVPTNKLYRNNGDGTFTDVTVQTGLDRGGFGQGCAVGDFDNDGFDDLVVTYLGGIVLYHNRPDGISRRRFVDVTEKSGLRDPHWATSAAWGDIDGDGFLDLYVCNYVEVDMEKYTICEQKGLRYSCSPTIFPHVTHKLFRNQGNGTFADVSQSSGIAAAPPAPGLGVLICDLDGDGRADIYAANDMRPAYLFHNQGGGKFVEKGLLAGCGLGPYGGEIAGMGVEAGDVDGSGWPSLFVTNFQDAPNVLFRNKGKMFFLEQSYPSGLGFPSLRRLGFGTVFVDADLDGHLDVAVANGHVNRPAAELFGASFAQQAQFFTGDGKAKFRDATAQAGAYFQELRVGRGLAWADFDNDGLVDLAFSHNGGPIALLRNQTATKNHWLRLELIGDGKKSNRNAIGTRIEIEAGGRKQVCFLNGGGSYLSANERRLLVGLGDSAKVERVTLQWPSGLRQSFQDLAADAWWRFVEGSEQPERVKAGPAER